MPPTYADCNRLWVDSRVRAVAQRVVEVPVLRRLGGRVDGGRALDIGTGRRGTGLRLAVLDFEGKRLLVSVGRGGVNLVDKVDQ